MLILIFSIFLIFHFWTLFESEDHNYYFKLPVPPEVASVREEVWERYGLDHLNSIDDLSEIEESSANITSCTEEGEDLSSWKKKIISRPRGVANCPIETTHSFLRIAYAFFLFCFQNIVSTREREKRENSSSNCISSIRPKKCRATYP